jgi:hypothetical protein
VISLVGIIRTSKRDFARSILVGFTMLIRIYIALYFDFACVSPVPFIPRR